MKVFPSWLLKDSRCPCCGGGLEVGLDLSSSAAGLEHGTLKCDCYEYPVVEGIAVLRQMSPVSSKENGAVERLRSNDVEGALEWLIAVGSAPGVPDPSTLAAQQRHSRSFTGRALKLLGRTAATASEARVLIGEADFQTLLHKSRPEGYANYLFQRFANPSFLAAIPAMLTLGDACSRAPRARLLDLLCGIGHSSATMSNLCPGVDIVMADADYVNLFIARRFVAPHAAAICLDVELPMPFANDAFEGLFCLDGLHYVRSKVALLAEADRVLGPNACWAFAHMHNAARHNVNPGTPLTAAAYTARFKFGKQRLVPESHLTEQIRADGRIDLSLPSHSEALESSDALTLFGGRDDMLWRAQTALHAMLARRPDLLALNPLYRVTPVTDGIVGTVAWPSESLRRECTKTGALLHDRIELSQRMLNDIANAQVGGEFSATVQKLIREFVLVPLPECYPRVPLLAQRELTVQA
jgi:SAM-dependent methyltransferase